MDVFQLSGVLLKHFLEGSTSINQEEKMYCKCCTLLIWVNVVSLDQFLQENVPLRHLLNEILGLCLDGESGLKKGSMIGP